MPRIRQDQTRIQELKEQITHQKKLYARQKTKISALEVQMRNLQEINKKSQDKKINPIRSARKGTLYRKDDTSTSSLKSQYKMPRTRRAVNETKNYNNETDNQYGLQPLGSRPKAKSRYSFVSEP